MPIILLLFVLSPGKNGFVFHPQPLGFVENSASQTRVVKRVSRFVFLIDNEQIKKKITKKLDATSS